MDRDTFIKLMREEWEKRTLSQYVELCDGPVFDMLWSIRYRLYDFFYPLGIGANGIYDVARICSDLHYAFFDDGDLSIVAAHLESRPDSWMEPGIKHADVFVVRGYYTDPLHVEEWATNVLTEFELKSFVAAKFDEEMLSSICSLKDRFAEEERIGKLDAASDEALDYGEYCQETVNLIEKMVKDRDYRFEEK